MNNTEIKPDAIFNGRTMFFPAIKVAGKYKVYRGVSFPNKQDAVEFAEVGVSNNTTKRYK